MEAEGIFEQKWLRASGRHGWRSSPVSDPFTTWQVRWLKPELVHLHHTWANRRDPVKTRTDSCPTEWRCASVTLNLHGCVCVRVCVTKHRHTVHNHTNAMVEEKRWLYPVSRRWSKTPFTSLPLLNSPDDFSVLRFLHIFSLPVNLSKRKWKIPDWSPAGTKTQSCGGMSDNGIYL